MRKTVKEHPEREGTYIVCLGGGSHQLVMVKPNKFRVVGLWLQVSISEDNSKWTTHSISANIEEKQLSWLMKNQSETPFRSNKSVAILPFVNK